MIYHVVEFQIFDPTDLHIPVRLTLMYESKWICKLYLIKQCFIIFKIVRYVITNLITIQNMNPRQLALLLGYFFENNGVHKNRIINNRIYEKNRKIQHINSLDIFSLICRLKGKGQQPYISRFFITHSFLIVQIANNNH